MAVLAVPSGKAELLVRAMERAKHILHVVIGAQKGPVHAQRYNVPLGVGVILGQRSGGIRGRLHQ